MNLLLLFVLVLTNRQTQLVKAGFSIALPLLVRSPYFSSWIPQLNISNLSTGRSSQHFRGTTTSNLSQPFDQNIFVRVDGTPYSIFGASSANFDIKQLNVSDANVTNIVMTPTQITLIAQAGPMQVNMSFFNPVEPGDWVRQSIPFSYLSITAQSRDGSTHKMEVYSDFGPYWVSTTDTNTEDLQWNVISNDEVIYHTSTILPPVLLSEDFSQAAWGTFYYATKADNNVTYKISDAPSAISIFASNGTLDNQGAAHTGISLPIDIVFAISCDLGMIQATRDPVVFVLGYTTDPAIAYPAQSGIPAQQRKPYYKLQYSDDESLIIDFLNDFGNASKRAQELDRKILQDAASVSNLLGDLVTLAVPQVFGSTQLTIGTDANGGFNESDVMVFMKNIGGDAPNRVNAVETLYAAFPALMYIDPSLGAPLLEPLFQLQAGSDVQFAASDLGGSYPNVSVPNFESTRNVGVEQSGNMLIMTYAHALASGNGSLISRYYRLLTSWADYLSNSTLYSDLEIDIDSPIANAVLTDKSNLAIKGIIAIEAMSKMSSVFGQIADANRYSNITANLYGQWKTLALGGDKHIQAAYNSHNSWTLGHNLFADVWLGTEVVESSIYDGHSAFINNITLNEVYPNQTLFDLPLTDSAYPPITISAWNLFVAAMTPNNDLRSNLIGRVHKRASSFGSLDMGTFPVRYSSVDGSDFSGMASPAQGAMLAPLALKVPVQKIRFNTTTATTTTTTSTKSRGTAKTRNIIVGVVGLLLIVAIVGLIRWHRRRRNIRNIRPIAVPQSPTASILSVFETGITPFTSTHPDTTNGGQVPGMDPHQSRLGSHGAVTSTEGRSSSPLLSIPNPWPLKTELYMGTETSPPTIASPVSDERGSRSSSSAVATTEQSEASSSSAIRYLQAQYDQLWCEIQGLRAGAEIYSLEAPPSYA